MELKIGLLNDSFPPMIDGVANAVYNYADIINKKYGTSVAIAPFYPNTVDNHPFEVYRYSSINFKGKIPYRVGNPFSPMTIRELKKKEFDLLHNHCPFASGVLARQLNSAYLKSNRIPTVFTYHTKFDVDLHKYVGEGKFYKIAHNFVLSNINAADEVWVVSEGAGKDLKNFGYKKDYLVMPNGTDFKRGRSKDSDILKIRNAYEINPDTLTFLFVGRMFWYKNLKLIFDGLAELKKSGLKFKAIFVGDGLDRPAAEQYSKNLNLGEETIFIGSVCDREKVRSFFSLSDLLLFPSTYDTSGLVVKEAAACSCPALVVKGSCAAEDITDGVSGILIEENPEDFAKKILEATKNKHTLKELGENASKYVYYSWEQAVDKAYKRYEEIVKASQSI